MAGLIDIGSAVGPALKSLVDKLVPDRAAAAAAKTQIDVSLAAGELQQEIAQLVAVTSAQSDIDKIEAGSSSLFIAGWRPFVGWICGVGLAMSCIIGPLFTWITQLCGHPTPFPKLDDPLLQATLAGMLGLGYGLRTVEKWRGVQGAH